MLLCTSAASLVLSGSALFKSFYEIVPLCIVLVTNGSAPHTIYLGEETIVERNM